MRSLHTFSGKASEAYSDRNKKHSKHVSHAMCTTLSALLPASGAACAALMPAIKSTLGQQNYQLHNNTVHAIALSELLLRLGQDEHVLSKKQNVDSLLHSYSRIHDPAFVASLCETDCLALSNTLRLLLVSEQGQETITKSDGLEYETAVSTLIRLSMHTHSTVAR